MGEAKQAARAEQQWLPKAFRPCMSVTIVGIVPHYLSNHAYGFCVTMTEVHYTIAAMPLTPCCGF